MLDLRRIASSTPSKFFFFSNSLTFQDLIDTFAFAPDPFGMASTKVVPVENPTPELLTVIAVIAPFVTIGVSLASFPEPVIFNCGIELYPLPPLSTKTSLIEEPSITGCN